MTPGEIGQLFLYVIPAAITGLVAYYFFSLHTKNEDGRRRWLLHKDIQKETLPVRLQAYERMTLFLERISPANLLVRVQPNGQDKEAYERELIRQIETEFEHNLSQQIYMTDDCWNVIRTAKNATIQSIRSASMGAPDDPDKLREGILNHFMEGGIPSTKALSYLKTEFQDLWKL